MFRGLFSVPVLNVDSVLDRGAVFTEFGSIQNELVLQRPRGTWCAMTIPKEDGEPAMVHAGFED